MTKLSRRGYLEVARLLREAGSDKLQGTRNDKDKAVQMAQTFYHVLEVYAVFLYYNLVRLLCAAGIDRTRQCRWHSPVLSAACRQHGRRSASAVQKGGRPWRA